MLPPLPVPPAPGVAEPEGAIARVAFSEFAGTPGCLPGCAETTTPAPEDAGFFPVPTPDDEPWPFDEDGSGGGRTEAPDPPSVRSRFSDASSVGGAATAAFPKPRTERGWTRWISTGGGTTALPPNPRMDRDCVL
jgi:hypothetical protein